MKPANIFRLQNGRRQQLKSELPAQCLLYKLRHETKHTSVYRDVTTQRFGRSRPLLPLNANSPEVEFTWF